MPSIDLNTVTPATLQQLLTTHETIVACLCADWCDVCKTYRPKFDLLASQFPGLLFMWVDIEDQSGLVDHLEIDNFPTLLIQQRDIVSFYGVMRPDTTQLERLIQTQIDQSAQQLQTQSQSGELQRSWQTDANLRQRIAEHV
jgi:thioredoxin 1